MLGRHDGCEVFGDRAMLSGMSGTEPGLRERKKARTRAELQRHALRLFEAHGYAATTVDDIAAAADVSREKRALEETRTKLVRTIPELELAACARSPFTVGAIAELLAEATRRDPSDVEVVALAGVVVGARLAAQSLVDRDHGRSYVDALDAVLEVLEGGSIPLIRAASSPPARRPAPPAARSRG
jgi:MftR C-terminal domain/Bacterial regulatory proteins, tetR family